MAIIRSAPASNHANFLHRSTSGVVLQVSELRDHGFVEHLAYFGRNERALLPHLELVRQDVDRVAKRLGDVSA
jgi:hypothetical protein